MFPTSRFVITLTFGLTNGCEYDTPLKGIFRACRREQEVAARTEANGPLTFASLAKRRGQESSRLSEDAKQAGRGAKTGRS